MRTTLIIPDSIFTRIKTYSQNSGESISKIVAEALELYILKKNNKSSQKILKLNTYSMGKPLVNVNNRDSIYKVFDSRL